MPELILSSQQLLAKELEEYMGIKIIDYKYVHKQAGTIHTVAKLFEKIQWNNSLVLCPTELTFFWD